jgi:hypothetical protein
MQRGCMTTFSKMVSASTLLLPALGLLVRCLGRCQETTEAVLPMASHAFRLMFFSIKTWSKSKFKTIQSNPCALHHSVALQQMTWVVRDAHKPLLGSLAGSMILSSTMLLDREDHAPTQLPLCIKQDSSCHNTVNPLTGGMLTCRAPAAARLRTAGT